MWDLLCELSFNVTSLRALREEAGRSQTFSKSVWANVTQAHFSSRCRELYIKCKPFLSEWLHRARPSLGYVPMIRRREGFHSKLCCSALMYALPLHLENVSVCLCVFLAVWVCASNFVCMYLFMCLYVSMCVYLYMCLGRCLCMCLSVCLYMCVPLCVSVHVPVCLCVCLLPYLLSLQMLTSFTLQEGIGKEKNIFIS